MTGVEINRWARLLVFAIFGVAVGLLAFVVTTGVLGWPKVRYWALLYGMFIGVAMVLAFEADFTPW